MTQISHRIRRRIACELVVAARTYKGFVRDLSADGCFVQMDAAALKADGVHAELRLSESSFCAPLTLQCELARREVTPAMFGTVADRGVELRITEAPAGYHEACLAATAAQPQMSQEDGAEDDSGLGRKVGLELEVDPDTEVAGRPLASTPGLTRDPSVEEVHEQDEDSLSVALREADMPASRSKTAPLATSVADTPAESAGGQRAAERTLGRSNAQSEAELEAREAVARRTQAALDAMRAAVFGTTKQIDAMLVYDGHELDDLYALLEDVGVKPLRSRLTGPTRYDGWTHPPRVFLIPAKAALSMPLPDGASAQNVCRIAVTDSTSGVLGTLVARLGYNYLIRRPVHPDVLRMLFERALYRGAESRRNQRRPAARSVSLRVGWRRFQATLVDISRGGARLLVRSDVDLLDSVLLVLPASATGSRKLKLRGRVIRKRRNERDGVVSVALRFAEEVEAAWLTEISRNFGNGSLGPAPAPLVAWIDRIRSWWEARGGRRAGPVTAAVHEEVAPPDAPRERRHLRRSLLDTEVVRLDPETEEACAVLIGRDLSMGGMRIDPAPETAVGDRLSLALHDPCGAPLILNARVARDDGPRGMVIEFDDLTQTTAARLERLVGDLPTARVGERQRVGQTAGPENPIAISPGVESLGDAGPEGIVLARVLPTQQSPLDVRP